MNGGCQPAKTARRGQQAKGKRAKTSHAYCPQHKQPNNQTTRNTCNTCNNNNNNNNTACKHNHHTHTQQRGKRKHASAKVPCFFVPLKQECCHPPILRTAHRTALGQVLGLASHITMQGHVTSSQARHKQYRYQAKQGSMFSKTQPRTTKNLHVRNIFSVRRGKAQKHDDTPQPISTFADITFDMMKTAPLPKISWQICQSLFHPPHFELLSRLAWAGLGQWQFKEPFAYVQNTRNRHTGDG